MLIKKLQEVHPVRQAARVTIATLIVGSSATGCSETNSLEAESNSPRTVSSSGASAASSNHAILPTPLPTTGTKAPTEEKPARQAPGCKRNGRGELENPRSYPYELTPQDSPLTRAVVTADLAALTKVASSDPGVAAREENGWLLSYVLEHGCFDVAKALVELGAPVVYNGQKRAAQVRTLPLLMQYANKDLFSDFLPKALEKKSDYPQVWSQVFGKLCSAPTSFWPVLKANSAPLMRTDLKGHAQSEGYQPPAWLGLLDCPSKDMLQTVFNDLGDDKPTGALAAFVDGLCVEPGQPPRDAMPPTVAADTIWVLRHMGYKLDEEVEYFGRDNKKGRGSALSLSQGKECTPEVANALGRGQKLPG